MVWILLHSGARENIFFDTGFIGYTDFILIRLAAKGILKVTFAAFPPLRLVILSDMFGHPRDVIKQVSAYISFLSLSNVPSGTQSDPFSVRSRCAR